MPETILNRATLRDWARDNRLHGPGYTKPSHASLRRLRRLRTRIQRTSRRANRP